MTDNTHRSGNGNGSGYIVEWRIPEGVKICKSREVSYPAHEWREAPYDLKLLAAGGLGQLVRPVIKEWDGHESPYSIGLYGLVTFEVAEAILACLKTLVIAHPAYAGAQDLIEYRLRLCDLRYSFDITKREAEGESDRSGFDTTKGDGDGQQ